MDRGKDLDARECLVDTLGRQVAFIQLSFIEVHNHAVDLYFRDKQQHHSQLCFNNHLTNIDIAGMPSQQWASRPPSPPGSEEPSQTPCPPDILYPPETTVRDQRRYNTSHDIVQATCLKHHVPCLPKWAIVNEAYA